MPIPEFSKTTALSSFESYIPKATKAWRSFSSEWVSKIILTFFSIVQVVGYKVFSVVVGKGVAV